MRDPRVVMRTALVILALAPLVGACTYDWEKFDPRLVGGAGGAGGSPTGGGGAGAVAGSGGSAGTGGLSGGSGGTGGSVGGSGGSGALGPWQNIRQVTELSDPEDDDDPTFTADLLELYINTGRGAAGADIWKSTRASPSSPWGTPVEAAEFSATGGNTNPAIAPDGLTIWFTSFRDVSDGDIYVSTRPDRFTAWSTPVAVPELNSSGFDGVGSVSTDGLTLMLYSDRGPTGSDDLYVSTHADTSDPWGAPVAITELNTPQGDSQQWLGPQGLTLYFDSTRDGDRDIFVSTRPVPSGSWGAPAAVTELNTSDSDSDAWLSPDMRYVMFTRGPLGTREIYEASR